MIRYFFFLLVLVGEACTSKTGNQKEMMPVGTVFQVVPKYNIQKQNVNFL
jgi:hypothetical protein